MSRLTIIIPLFFVVLFVGTNCETPTQKHLSFQLDDNDVIPKDQTVKTRVRGDEVGFIGDLIVGRQLADETVFRRNIEIKNYDPFVSFYSIDFSVKSGTIHYLSIRNNRNSYAVACDGPYTLGKSVTRFIVRVLPRTDASLSVELATHPE